MGASAVHPSSEVEPGTKVVQIPENIVAQIILQVLCRGGIPGFRTGPYSVKQIRSVFQIKSEALEMVVPVGILNNYPHIGIDLAGRIQNQCFPGFRHQFQAVFRPAHIAFGFYAERALAAGKEKIVQDEIVKITCRMFSYLLYLFPMFRIGVAKCLKTVGFIYGVGNSSSHFQSFFLKKANGFTQCGIRDDQQVTVGFQVYPVHLYLFGNDTPGRIKPLAVFHLFYFVGAGIYGNFKILVLLGTCKQTDQQADQG